MHAPFSAPSIHVASRTDHAEFPVVERLVVLRPAIGDASDAGDPAAAELLLILMTKANRVAVVEDAPSVMLELKRGALAVVLLEPAMTATISELVAAVTRYFPRVTIWRSDAVQGGRAGPLVRLASTISVSAASQPHGPGPGEAADHPDPQPLPPPAAEHDEALVSEEELAMLMGPLPGGSKE